MENRTTEAVKIKTPFLGCAYYPEDWNDDQLAYDVAFADGGFYLGGKIDLCLSSATLALLQQQ